jgi:hypothetical protein
MYSENNSFVDLPLLDVLDKSKVDFGLFSLLPKKSNGTSLLKIGCLCCCCWAFNFAIWGIKNPNKGALGAVSGRTLSLGALEIGVLVDCFCDGTEIFEELNLWL